MDLEGLGTFLEQAAPFVSALAALVAAWKASRATKQAEATEKKLEDTRALLLQVEMGVASLVQVGVTTQVQVVNNFTTETGTTSAAQLPPAPEPTFLESPPQSAPTHQLGRLPPPREPNS